MMHISLRKTILAALVLLLFLCLTACERSMATERPAAAPTPAVDALSASREVSDFKVSDAFSSNMVLQRDEPIRIWGWAPASRNGETVTAVFLGKSAEGKIKNGEWLLTFEEGFAVNAAMGNDLKITCGSSEILFEDVLVGDVYMVIGQSNVAYSMNAHCAARGQSISSLVDEAAPIRLKYNTLNDTNGYPKRGTEEVCSDVVNGRPWWTNKASYVNQFTALGYLFATEIVERTEGAIPVGIIEIDGNGQPIGAFMSNEAAAATGSDTYNKNSGIYVPPGVNGTAARYMYNHYMYPYEKYAIAGVVWYQGESDFDRTTANSYVEKFTALMQHMRSTHNVKNPDFPVYIVELPTIYRQPAGHSGAWHFMDLGYIRAEMGSIPRRLTNTYLAVSSDIFTDDRYDNSLHPNIKAEQAARLATLAGSVWYGLSPMDKATGPILKAYDISADRKTVTLTFDNVGTGLMTADGRTAVRGMVAFAKSGALLPTEVTATITGYDQITVVCTKAMYGVAYNAVADNFYGKEINLCNSAEQPAAAFTYSEKQMSDIRYELIGESPADTALTAEDMVAIRFCTPSAVTAVGTQLREAASGTTVKLSIYAFTTDYATTLQGDPLLSEIFTDPARYSWVELTCVRGETFAAGDYLLVISGASGVSIRTAGAHEGQIYYQNGEIDSERSMLLGLTYAMVPTKLYEAPGKGVEESSTETEALETTVAEDTTGGSTITEVETEAMDGGCASAWGMSLAILLPIGAMLIWRKRGCLQATP